MIHPRDEDVLGPEPPLGSEHNCAQYVENARTCKMVAVSVRAHAVAGKTIMSSCASRRWVAAQNVSDGRE
jgi:hypothetical protein